MTNLITISGKKGSGKNTVADIIVNLTTPKPDKFEEDEFGRPYKEGNNWVLQSTKSPYKLKSFAYKLKEICSLMTGIPIEDFDKQEVKSSYLDSKWDIINETQPCGCDWIMDHGHRDGKCNNCEAPTETTRTPQTVRDLLVEVGSHMRKLNPEVWVDALFQDYKSLPKFPFYEGNYMNRCSLCENIFIGDKRQPVCKDCVDKQEDNFPLWIITDLRTLNEYEVVKARGGKTIRIERPCSSCGLIKGHKMSCMNNKYEHYSETDLDNAEFNYTIINDSSLEDLIRKVEVILKAENII